MAPKKYPLRRLVIGTRTYLWRRSHRHPVHDGQRQCQEVLRIFAAPYKRTYVEIIFSDQPGWAAGYSSDGVICSRTAVYNLNRPAVVAALIRYLLMTIWDPDTTQEIVTIDDGIPLLALADAPTGYA